MITEARREDLAALVRMAGELARWPVPAEVRERELAAALAGGPSVVLVARVAGTAVGYALGAVVPMPVYGGMAFLQELWVDPEHRGTRLGRDLVRGFETAALGRGAGVAALATSRAGAFYEHLGYDPGATYYRRRLGPDLP